MAAAALSHGKARKAKDGEDHLGYAKRAREFAVNELLPVLALGELVSVQKLQRALNTAADFIGLPPDSTVVDFEDELPASLKPPRVATYTVTDVNSSLKRIDVVVEFQVGTRTETLNYSSFIGELGVGQ